TTTSIENNSVFRSFFEKQKLTGPNFIDWYRQLRLLLSVEDEENYTQNHIPVAPPGQQTVREFYTSKQEEGQSVSSYVLKMKGYIKNLEQLDQPVGQNLAVSLILVSLNKDFDNFMQNYNMHSMGKTMNELHAMVKLYEEMLPKKDVNTALHAIRAGRVQKNKKNKSHKAGKRSHGKCKGKMANASNNVSFASKPKTTPPPKKDNPAKDAICHQCGKVRHWRRNCPGLWGRKKLKPCALSLYVGDGRRTTIEAIKTYHLELPSGLVIVLNNCHYAPSITRARLVAKGFTQTYRVDYEETFSLVADIRAIRILIYIAAYYDYEIWKMNVKTAFLNGHLFEEVYMEQPEGFVNPKYPNHNMTSRFQQDPGEEHWTAVKNIFKYLHNTKDMFLTGYVFVLNGGAIDWKSTKQSIFATSSTDAEYIDAFDALKEAVWIRKFIIWLGIIPTIREPISMYCDNIGAIAIAKVDGVTKGGVKIEKIHTDDNLADPFTKALAFPKHSELTRNIGLLPASSFL
nr:zinc finger, CCHC-type [Tanacetum cinerariifolium]